MMNQNTLNHHKIIMMIRMAVIVDTEVVRWTEATLMVLEAEILEISEEDLMSLTVQEEEILSVRILTTKTAIKTPRIVEIMMIITTAKMVIIMTMIMIKTKKIKKEEMVDLRQ